MIVEDHAHFSHFLIAHLIVVPPLIRATTILLLFIKIPHMFAIRVNLRERRSKRNFRLSKRRKMIVDFLLQKRFSDFFQQQTGFSLCRVHLSPRIFLSRSIFSSQTWERITQCKISRIFFR
jgi:hypothetical protein